MTSSDSASAADSPATSSLADRLSHALARLALRHAGLIVALAVLLIGAGGYLGSKLSLQTDLSELLPPTASSVIELKALNKRVGGTGGVAVALYGEPASLRKFVPRLVDILRKQLGPELLAIKYQRKEVDDYKRRFAAWYVPVADLQKWQGDLKEVVADEKERANPAFVDLTDEEPHASARALAARIRQKENDLGPKNTADPETGLLMSENGHLAVLFLRPAANSLNLAASGKLLDHIRQIITSALPPDVRLEGFTGSIPSAIAEFGAIERDIASTALLVVLLVGGVVVLFFRSIRELLLLSLALAVGCATAFAFAYLWIGHVNAQTAFLGSIIIGTGINYGIILLARYGQLRRQGVAFESALPESLAVTLRATGIAALATGVSFGVLAAGQVESFHQFGWIGGLGILACWLATFTVVPAMLVLFDRRRVYRPRTHGEPLAGLLTFTTNAVARHPRVVLVLSIVLSLGSLAALYHRRHDPLETDISKLGTKSTKQSGIQKLDSRLRKMDTGSSTPAVVATSSREEATAVCQQLTAVAEATDHRFMNRCFTLDATLPDHIEEHRPLLRQLAADIDQIPLDGLDARDRDELTMLRKSMNERPPVASDLPPTIAEPFVERDGSIGKLAFVEPHNDSVAANLFAFADALRNIPLPSGKVIHSSGENVVFTDVLRAVAVDARRLTLAAALLVLLVLLLVTRSWAPFWHVALALLVGVLWMAGLAALSGQRLNFFNFVALPTTFGIAIDYAINVDERIRSKGRARLAEAVGEVGPAVALASATTILGYVSLLLADNQALVSFGKLAILGEATCLVAALVLVPLLWLRRKDGGPISRAK